MKKVGLSKRIFMKEAERLAEMRQRDKEYKETELMEEEDRLVRVYVRHLKKCAREEAKLVKIDNVIIKTRFKTCISNKSKTYCIPLCCTSLPSPWQDYSTTN